MGSLTAYDAIKSHLDGKKTPYQLDLEVKDRKPSIIPKVGDRVKIKSREWYEKWKVIKDYDEFVFADGHNFWGASRMKDCLGKVFTVTSIDRDGYLKLDDGFGFYWSLVMFEEVYPVQEQLSSKFPKIDLNSPYLYQSPYEVKGSELIFSKKVKKRFLQQLRNQWGIKPKLKQVKTTHLLKLKKL